MTMNDSRRIVGVTGPEADRAIHRADRIEGRVQVKPLLTL